MTGLYEALFIALVASCVVVGLASLYYLCWFAYTWRDPDVKPRSLDRAVRREARWGMLMASPLLFAVLSSAAAPGTWWWAAVLAVCAAGAFYAIPVLAMRGVPLPRVVRWIPAAVAIPTVPVLMAASGDPFIAIIVLIFGGGFGFSYATGSIVAVRFARAVRARDAGAKSADRVDETGALEMALK